MVLDQILSHPIIWIQLGAVRLADGDNPDKDMDFIVKSVYDKQTKLEFEQI